MVNLISGISLFGVSIGTAALIVILSVFNGFENLVISLYDSFDSEFKVEPLQGKYFEVNGSQLDEIESWPGVSAVTPVIEENVLAKFNDKQTLATMKAIYPAYLSTVGLDTHNVYVGDVSIFDGVNHLAIVGSGVASKLDLNIYDQFNSMQLYIPKAKKVVLNPRRAFSKMNIRPSGVFSIQKEFDDKYIVLPYNFGADLALKPNQATSIEVNIEKGVNPSPIRQKLSALFGPDFDVKNRQEQHSFIHKILNSEKFFVYLILSFVLLIAAFNLVGTLTMLAIEKKKDVAILSSLGMDAVGLQRVFALHGLIMSFTGAMIGLGVGTLMCYLQMKFEIITIPGATFVANAYPVAFNGYDHLLVLGTVAVIGFLASWLPSKNIGKQVDLSQLQVR